jgi:hypothetical protein
MRYKTPASHLLHIPSTFKCETLPGVSPTRDNLVSAVLGHSTMPPDAGLGSWKELALSLSDLAVRLDRLEEILRALIAKVGDVD